MKHFNIIFTLFYCSVLFSEYPASPERPVAFQFPGCQIVDPYQWLENDNDPAVQRWDLSQNDYTEKALSEFKVIPAIEKRLNAFREASSYCIEAGTRIITIQNSLEEEQPVFFIQEDEESAKTELLNPNKLGKNIAVEAFEISPDGNYLAYAITQGGNEQPKIYLIDLNTLTHLKETLEGPFQSNLTWHPNSKGFFYTAYPPGEFYYHQAVYYHQIGSSQDRLLFCDPEKIAWLIVLFPGQESLQIVRHAWTDKGLDISECYQIPIEDLDAEPKLTWRSEPGKPVYIPYEINGTTYYLTDFEAPNFRIIKQQKKDYFEFIPESRDLLLDFCQVGNNLAATYRSDGRIIIKLFDPSGKFLKEVPLPGIGCATIFPNNEPLTEVVFESMIQPLTVYTYDSLNNYLSFKHCLTKDPFDSSGLEVTLHLVKSKDGTKIPVFLASKKNLVKNGNTPTLIYGYGGFNMSMEPKFNSHFIPWIEAGGVVAMACLRGGGEYGLKWHLAGMRNLKQNTFDDCIATAEWLIKQKITNPSRLALAGQSNGGLLVGAVITQRPDLFKAAYSGVALLDMLRFDQFPLGALWIGEYGHPQDAHDFATLMSYSPYHYPLKKSVHPATLFIAGKNDYRVHCMHMRKMAARMQAAYPEGNPVLYWNDPASGHRFASTNSKNYTCARGYGFLMAQVQLPAAKEKKRVSIPNLDLTSEAKLNTEFIQLEKKHKKHLY